MKRYIKSAININQDLTRMTYAELEEFIKELEIGSTIKYECDCGDYEHPEQPLTHFILISIKTEEDDWIVRFGNDMSSLDTGASSDRFMTETVWYEEIYNYNDDPRYNGKILVSSDEGSHVTYLKDDPDSTLHLEHR